VVTDKPWSGFNYYLGDYRSTVAVNADLKQQMSNLPRLVAHESYPGHHTEHCRKEAGLVAGLGQLEQTIFLVNTPQCLMAEGLGDLALTAPFDLEGHSVVVGTSIGIALAPQDAIEPLLLMKNADLALYRAKSESSGVYRFFEPGMDQRMQARRDLERDLRFGLLRNEFELYYQPCQSRDECHRRL